MDLCDGGKKGGTLNVLATMAKSSLEDAKTYVWETMYNPDEDIEELLSGKDSNSDYQVGMLSRGAMPKLEWSQIACAFPVRVENRARDISKWWGSIEFSCFHTLLGLFSTTGPTTMKGDFAMRGDRASTSRRPILYRVKKKKQRRSFLEKPFRRRKSILLVAPILTVVCCGTMH